MNKKIVPMAGIAIAFIVAGVLVFNIPETEVEDEYADDNLGQAHDAVWSGPIGVTQYEHRLGENVYFIIRGLQSDEKGMIGVFTPEGILYKSFEYDGSKKTSFNQYFSPDTIAFLDICKPEQLVGIWNVVFSDNSYPPLQFEIINEYTRSGETSIFVEC